MGGRGMVAPAMALWAGLLMSGGAGAWGLAVAIVVAAAMGALAIRAPDRVGTVALALAGLAVGIARGVAQDRMPALPPSWDPDRRPTAIEARVIGHPWRTVDGRIAVLRILGAEDRRLVGIRVRARLPAGAAVEWGDRVTVLLQIERPPARRSPGGYDAGAALAAQGIAALGRGVAIRRAPADVATWERATCVRARRAVEAALDQLSPAAREVVLPLVVGDRGELGAELGADMQAAGLTHLIALSGLHVTWMAAIARGVAALAGGGPLPRALAGALCALAYVGIAGPLPSLARAAVTEGVLTWARLRDRPLDPIQALAVSVTVLLALCPGWSHDLGFQLSCAATAGLTTVGAAMNEKLTHSRGIGVALLRLLAPTAAAQLAAQPLLMARFHALPWTALAANLLAVPVCELALAAAWLGVVLEAVWPGSGATMFAACEALCVALRAIAGTAAAAPLALLPLGHHAGAAYLAGGAAVAIAIASAPSGRLAPRAPACAILLATGVALTLISIGFAATSPALRPPAGRWWLVALDVGQGDALALAFDDGWWLVDAGPRTPHFDAGSSVVLPFLRWAGVRRLSGMVVTHNHGDHAGGVKRVLAGVPQARVVVRAGWPPPRLPRGVSTQAVAMGDTLHHHPALVVRWPPRDAPGRDENAGSLVLEAGTGAGRALLAADIDSLIETELDVAPGLAVLKVAHHGAGRSSGSEALARWRPRHAVVSCGRRNPFGHPDDGTLERLRRAAAEVRRTDREGTVWLEIDARGVRHIDWRRAASLATVATPARAATGPGPLAAAPLHW